MKKIVALLLASMLALSFVACGDKTSNTNASKDDTSKEEISQISTEESKAEDNKEFTELVLVDNDECAIKITGIDPDNVFGYTLNAQLVNKSADKTFMFSVESATINGVHSDPVFAAEVPAGKTDNASISFFDIDLENNDIGDFTDIEMTLYVYDSEDWENVLVNETVHIYPYGEDKATKYVREPKDTDKVLMDNEYVTVIATGDVDDLFGRGVNLFVLNKSDKNIMLSVEDASVNDVMIDPFFATVVNADRCKFGSLVWSSESLEEEGITAMEKIEFNLRVYDNDNWSGDDFANEKITITL